LVESRQILSKYVALCKKPCYNSLFTNFSALIKPEGSFAHMKLGSWRVPEIFSADASLLEDGGYSKLLSAVLVSRGYDTPEKAAAYLSRDEALLSEPFLLSGMDKAVERLNRALAQKEQVAVYGDYDVDGITASCLLCDYLSRRGLGCLIYIPDRLDEGYGLNAQALESLKNRGISLVVTVDCGITALNEVGYAKALGLDIIITDHHECRDVLPECCAVINPKREQAGHPAANLAGVGVAMKLACALDGDANRVMERYCDLAAVGTIADVMPLVGENRVIVSHGLNKLRKDPRPGFLALLEEAGVMDKPLTASVVGYTLAPRINAAGRLCQTSKAVELLMSPDLSSARPLAQELCALNRRRQELELDVWNDSVERIGDKPPTGPIVLADESWHPGVVGIAASRLAEKYGMPAVIICLDGEDGKGSCRSFGDFNLFDALAACARYLEGFGGHAYAAGISVKKENIDLFRAALESFYAASAQGEQTGLCPELRLEDFSLLSMENVESLEELEPCGSGNLKPLLCLLGVSVDSLSEIGGGKHLRIAFSGRGTSAEGVFFSKSLAQLELATGQLADICFVPQINEFRSRKSVQLLISGMRPSEAPALCRSILEAGGDFLRGLSAPRLSKDSMASLWRLLRGCGPSIHISRLFTDRRFEGISPETVMLGIRVFKELGLLEFALDGDVLRYECRENGPKARLEDSPLFLALSKNGQGE
jgi:single-stranded-DNA-specific exonuclease